MSSDILKDIIMNKEEEFQNSKVTEIIKDNPSILKDYPLLEVEYNIDGSKKSLSSLASEKDIKETQLKSDENELDYKYSQNKISKEEYDKLKEELDKKLYNQNLVYDDLIFDIIDKSDIEDIKKEIKDANLNDIALNRLASSLSSIAENKIKEFQENNKNFRVEKLSYWNYKYTSIAKSYEKTREIESYILSLIK